ncbi:MAG: nicotinate-nicotinamide nucleotide adenylyltransferase, partial [Acidimicrobiia bacterium]
DLVESAVRDVDGVEACDVELRRGGESYTANTLEDLASLHDDAEFFVILGSDAAAGLPTWRRFEAVRDLASIVVVDRPGVPTTEALPGWRWNHVEVPHVEVSSTDLRNRVIDGRPLEFLLTSSTIDAIRRLGLYRDAA